MLKRLADSESVVHIDDLVLRRSDWGLASKDTRRVVERIIPLLGWEKQRQAIQWLRAQQLFADQPTKDDQDGIQQDELARAPMGLTESCFD